MSFYNIPKNLTDLNHFRNNPMVQFKEETVGGVEVVIPCYMIADADLWKQPFATELRGHVFRKDTGELISAALPKFFNVGEKVDTQRHILPWDEVASIADKRDGSMITFAVINGKVYAKTKKSFYSDVAKLAQAHLDRAESEGVGSHIAYELASGRSPVYEFWHPEWQIVLNYGSVPSATFLGIRDMNNGEWQPEHIDTTARIQDLETWQYTAEGVEGVVVQFKSGLVVKAKTAWYLRQHRVQTELRERDVAEMAADEKLDDVKSAISEAGLELALVEDIERRVAADINTVRNEVLKVVANAKLANIQTPKEMAIRYKGHIWFGLIMNEFRGLETDYVSHFKKNMLATYSLRCVYNTKF